jgi:hypothetical protein
VSSYVVQVKPSARKELEALPDNVLTRSVRKMESLSQNPKPAGCKKLKGYKDQCPAPRSFFWHECGILAESPEPLRTADRSEEGREIHPGPSQARTARSHSRMMKIPAQAELGRGTLVSNFECAWPGHPSFRSCVGEGDGEVSRLSRSIGLAVVVTSSR